MRVLKKTGDRTGTFLLGSLAWRVPDRQYAGVAWCMFAGALWLIVDRSSDQDWMTLLLLGPYLLAILAAICAIDARFGIIPDSLVLGLVVGGAIDALWESQVSGFDRGLEAIVVLILGSAFRSIYRRLRGHDGLGFGDVKLTVAGTLWIGIAGVPGLLLIAVASAFVSLLILAVQGSKLHGKQAISFGPHLALGLWLSWIAGPMQFNIGI